MAAHCPVMREVVRRAERGVAVLGICNGFQILTEAGLLPGALIRNAGLRFVCRWVELEVATSDSVFTAATRAPASACRSPTTTATTSPTRTGSSGCDDEDRVAFRYRDNPNGSAADIAGVLGPGATCSG